LPPMSPPDVAELTDEQVDKQNGLKQAGVELLEDGKLEEALSKFSEAIVIGCASALLYSRRAGVLMQLGRTQAVINDCTAALMVNPDSAKALKMRARANAKLELWEQANQDFQEGLKMDFDDQTEEDSKLAFKMAKEIREAAVSKRVQKEQDDFQTKLKADAAAYEAAVKARDAVWTDSKEEKYQETLRKIEEEKKRKEQKAAREAFQAQSAATKEAADNKDAAEKGHSPSKAEPASATGGYASAADVTPPVEPNPAAEEPAPEKPAAA